MNTIITYARRSTDDLNRQTLSIESQIAELVVLAQRDRLEVRAVYQESQSARKPGRPEFGRMLKDLKKHPGAIILCWQLDRLARNLQDAATLTQYLQDGIIQEIRTPKATYGNSSMDLFISGLDFLIAKKYVDDLSENVKRGLRAKVQAGWRPGKPPLGYITSGPYRKGLRTIIPDPMTFDKVRQLWNNALQTSQSLSGLAKYATTLGLNISASGLQSMFSNPFYYGQFLWNNELLEGKHSPMLSYEEFSAVRKRIHRNTKARGNRLNFTFSGLLTCGECGGTVTAERSKKLIRSTKSIRTYTYYHCTHRKNPRCKQPSITEHELCKQILQYLKSIEIPFHEVDTKIRELETRESKRVLTSIPTRKHLDAQLRALDSQISGLLALMLSPANADHSIITNEEYKREKNKLLTKRQELKSGIQRHSDIRKQISESVSNVIRFRATARKRFESGTNDERQNIFSELSTVRLLHNKTLIIPDDGRHKGQYYRKGYFVESNQENVQITPRLLAISGSNLPVYSSRG